MNYQHDSKSGSPTLPSSQNRKSAVCSALGYGLRPDLSTAAALALQVHTAIAPQGAVFVFPASSGGRSSQFVAHGAGFGRDRRPSSAAKPIRRVCCRKTGQGTDGYRTGRSRLASDIAEIVGYGSFPDVSAHVSFHLICKTCVES